VVDPGDLLALALAGAALATAGYWVGRRTQPEAPAAAPRSTSPSPPRTSVDIAALADPALLIDGALRIIAANPAAHELIGNPAPGADLRLVLRHPAILDLVAEAATGTAAVTSEVAGLGSGEAAYCVRVVRTGSDRRLITFTDITQARLTERMRVDFVANASHELRTPLATLIGFIETLQGPAADDAQARQRFLDIMASEAGRMARLIDDLLSLSRIELEKYVRPQTTTPLAPLIADVARTLAMRLESDERQLVIDLPADLPDVIADRDQILQVLHNLISNAQKYGRAGTPITVAAQLEPGESPRVRISVSDQGEGIAPEILPRLTERFFRADTSRSRRLGGTGLGLAIAKHIVERHRGTLDISSTVGQGTRVSFTLPAAG
jgi:two-component system phosphate regulon sensor histidine kinase PhoR